MGPHVRWGWHHGVEKPPGTRLSWNTRHLPPPSSLLLSPSSLSHCTVTQHIHSGREGERERREGGREEGRKEGESGTNFYFLQLRGTCNKSNLLFLHIYTCLCLQERSTVSFINPRACAGGLLWLVCVCVCVCVCLSVCEQVFSRAMSAVGTERGGMDKHHGYSVQQETGVVLATERRFPAASSSMRCALIRDRNYI